MGSALKEEHLVGQVDISHTKHSYSPSATEEGTGGQSETERWRETVQRGTMGVVTLELRPNEWLKSAEARVPRAHRTEKSWGGRRACVYTSNSRKSAWEVCCEEADEWTVTRLLRERSDEAGSRLQSAKSTAVVSAEVTWPDLIRLRQSLAMDRTVWRSNWEEDLWHRRLINYSF